jgi:hypothetical protein
LLDKPDDMKLIEDLRKFSLSQTEVKRVTKLSVVHRKLKILENVPVVLNLFPSIIDYAVNVGLKETSDQWVQYLNEQRSLASVVQMKSVLSRNGLKFEVRN